MRELVRVLDPGNGEEKVRRERGAGGVGDDDLTLGGYGSVRGREQVRAMATVVATIATGTTVRRYFRSLDR